MSAQEFADIDAGGHRGDVLGQKGGKYGLGVDVGSTKASQPSVPERRKKKTFVHKFPKSRFSDQSKSSMAPKIVKDESSSQPSERSNLPLDSLFGIPIPLYLDAFHFTDASIKGSKSPPELAFRFLLLEGKLH